MRDIMMGPQWRDPKKRRRYQNSFLSPPREDTGERRCLRAKEPGLGTKQSLPRLDLRLTAFIMIVYCFKPPRPRLSAMEAHAE